MFGSLDTSVSALVTNRTRLEAYAANLANRNAIYDAQGNYNPYRRRIPIVAAGDPSTGKAEGTHVREIRLDHRPFIKKYEPGHPNADGGGYVYYPNIDTTNELINAMEASRAYEANVTVAEATKSMIQTSLRLLA